MYLLVILLISPAFGKPSSDRRDDGANIENQLDNLVDFSRDTGKLLSNPKLLERVSQSVEEAENNVLQMEAHLKSLQSKIPRLSSVENYFPEYNEAKSYLRQTRQELRELASRTKTEVEILNLLLDALDNSEDPVILKRCVDRMKILMKETKKYLEEAKKIYESANVAFDNLVSSLRVQNNITVGFLKQTKAEFLEDKKHTEQVRYNCKWAAVVTLGLCSLIHHFVNEVPHETARVELEDLTAATDKFLDGATILFADVGDAIKILNKELDQINNWEISAEQVSKNIVDYPEAHLRKIKTIRTTFRNGLNDLYEAANKFLKNQNVIPN